MTKPQNGYLLSSFCLWEKSYSMNQLLCMVVRGVILKRGSPGEPSLGSHENPALVLPTTLRIIVNFLSWFT